MEALSRLEQHASENIFTDVLMSLLVTMREPTKTMQVRWGL